MAPFIKGEDVFHIIQGLPRTGKTFYYMTPVGAVLERLGVTKAWSLDFYMETLNVKGILDIATFLVIAVILVITTLVVASSTAVWLSQT
jgi:hypothetical protein